MNTKGLHKLMAQYQSDFQQEADSVTILRQRLPGIVFFYVIMAAVASVVLAPVWIILSILVWIVNPLRTVASLENRKLSYLFDRMCRALCSLLTR